jgi:hypothetical protein
MRLVARNMWNKFKTYIIGDGRRERKNKTSESGVDSWGKDGYEGHQTNDDRRKEVETDGEPSVNCIKRHKLHKRGVTRLGLRTSPYPIVWVCILYFTIRDPSHDDCCGFHRINTSQHVTQELRGRPKSTQDRYSRYRLAVKRIQR